MNNFSLSGVFSETLARIRAGFGVHFLYALVPSLLSAAISFLAARSIIVTTGAADPAARLALFTSPLYWVSLLFGVLCSAWIATGLVGSMLERPPIARFPEMIAISLRNLLRFIVLYIVWYVLLVVGFVLLVIPGLIVLTMFAACVPALVDRNLGPWAALQESRRLTKGRRFAVFGSLIVFALILAIPSLAVVSALGFNVAEVSSLQQTMPLVSLAMTAVIAPLYNVIVLAFLVSLYAQLGGLSRSDILDTFG